jgi:cyanophycin synthetase
LDAEQAWVARTQVDVILPSSTAVLTPAAGGQMAELCDGRSFLRHGPNLPVMTEHRNAGGGWSMCVTTDRAGPRRQGSGHAAAGLVKPAKASQPEMVMAAVAAAWALNIPPELIGAGLRTFESNPRKTPY